MMPDINGKNLIPRHSIELDAQLSLQHILNASKNDHHQDLDTITINYDINQNSTEQTKKKKKKRS
jgi:hypothetical protein